MKKTKILTTILVFLIFLGTVSPVLVFAVETVKISNSVQSSANSGGMDGARGEDGADGQDGADGISGDSSATSKINTTVDGEVVNETVIETTNSGSAYSSADSSYTTSTQREIENTDGEPTIDKIHLTDDERSHFENLLNKLQSILQTYVNLLFS